LGKFLVEETNVIETIVKSHGFGDKDTSTKDITLFQELETEICIWSKSSIFVDDAIDYLQL